MWLFPTPLISSLATVNKELLSILCPDRVIFISLAWLCSLCLEHSSKDLHLTGPISLVNSQFKCHLFKKSLTYTLFKVTLPSLSHCPIILFGIFPSTCHSLKRSYLCIGLCTYYLSSKRIGSLFWLLFLDVSAVYITRLRT